jgi:rubredoxin
VTRPRGPYREVRFCPRCGVESLDKDRYLEGKNCPHAEYVCRTCGLGFRIGPSRRVAAADDLFREHRKRRHNRFADGVSEENANAFCKAYPH